MARPHHIDDPQDFPQHLTWVTKERSAVFAENKSADCCLWALEKERARLRVDVFAYALMPDHLHVVIGPSIWPLGFIVQGIKLATTYWLKAHGLASGPVWARGYWDRALRNEAALRRAIEYVHANPIKQGLCSDPADFSHSGAAHLSDTKKSVVQIALPPL
ncbi:MAG: transposase [Actinomycetota bacterium]